MKEKKVRILSFSFDMRQVQVLPKLSKPFHLKERSMYFPVRGHSYLPADRVFGILEKHLRRYEKIVAPYNMLNFMKPLVCTCMHK
ncbi:hypothetical protein ANN_12748 [Periplaneta americana]|uniref:Uncharacterized protein n=1 Tax=Periplaneta americana TaxID=6978 RepID=A0ABQ8TJC6_PERAM|nr:hypothetical protein ANN_12748 [Periplaneta americana]